MNVDDSRAGLPNKVGRSYTLELLLLVFLLRHPIYVGAATVHLPIFSSSLYILLPLALGIWRIDSQKEKKEV